jgi:heme exporter protein C
MGAKPRLLSILDLISILLLLTATGLVFFYTPVEAVMGPVQKVFYFHVSSAWIGMLGFLAAAVTGILFLRSSNRKWDIAGLAAVEVGMVFSFITVVSGSIWARPIWNTWWTWDPRLTTVTIMLLIYAAYLMLRSGIDDPDRRARFSAIYAIVGFLSVPLTFFSARAFRTIHPIVIGLGQTGSTGGFDMTGKMLTTFLFSLFTFSVLFVDLYWHRIRLGSLQDKVEHLKIRLNA